MGMIRSIFAAMPKAEIFLNFAVDTLISYLTDSVETRTSLKRVGLELPLSDLPTLKQAEPHRWRRIIQAMLHRRVQEASGAAFFTPFFIKSSSSSRAYWFLHLSSHQRARDAATDVHWGHYNAFHHYAGAGLHMFGHDPRRITRDGPVELYGFDEAAKDTTAGLLAEQLPTVLERLGGATGKAINCNDLYAAVANGTPATSEMIRAALLELYFRKDVDVYSKGGRRKHPETKIERSDKVRLSEQKKFSF